LGLGFDLDLLPKKNIQFTASILDVGFIKHSKDVETFTYKGYYKYEGINPNFSSTNTPENVYDQFNDAVPLDTVYNGYTTWRPIKMNSSYQYLLMIQEEGQTVVVVCRNRNIEMQSEHSCL
jgi:hypothetical protein